MILLIEQEQQYYYLVFLGESQFQTYLIEGKLQLGLRNKQTNQNLLKTNNQNHLICNRQHVRVGWLSQAQLIMKQI